jgi:tetraacyldisaccharide 4'-kinase
VAAARWAREHLGAEVFVLDDGFQHLRIARDLDVVTLDATAPWGGGHLLPRGRLREPVSELKRAGCVVITRAELATDLEALRAEVARLCDVRAAVVVSRVRTRGLIPLLELESRDAIESRDAVESRSVGQPVAAFCAVGNPRAFFEHVRRDGFELCYTRAFPDHHAYTRADVETLTREAVRRGALSLLTTAKDGVKLRGRDFALPCYVLEIGLEFEDEGRLLGLVRNAAHLS